MIELSEGITLAKQATELLKGKTVSEVFPPSYLHKFTFFNADPSTYGRFLVGKKLTGASAHGIFVDLLFEGSCVLSINDGVNVRYGKPDSCVPSKYQLLITFVDGSFLWFKVAMYGGVALHEGDWNNKYYQDNKNKLSILDERYTKERFDQLVAAEKKNISVKAMLATHQRIPGIGNGVLQDILFRARIHPKRRIHSLTDDEKTAIYRSLKKTLQEMTDAGGRDTENDLFGNRGGYVTLLSRNTFGKKCPVCETMIVREPYMGGTVYFCPSCQKP